LANGVNGYQWYDASGTTKGGVDGKAGWMMTGKRQGQVTDLPVK
jgi:hypothetical protein